MNEDLIRAAEYLDQHGWTQGQLNDDLGRVCLYGALSSVFNRKMSQKKYRVSEYIMARDHLRNFIADMRGIPVNEHKQGQDNVVYLNDFLLKSGEEASKVLREAAEWVPNA